MSQGRNPLLRTSLASAIVLAVLNVRCGKGNDSSSSAADGGAGRSSAGGSGSAISGRSSAAGSGTAIGGRASAGAAGLAIAGSSANAGSPSAGNTSRGGAGGRNANTAGAVNAGGSPARGGSNAAGAAGAPSVPGWTLVFSDEFNGAKGTAVDSSKWNLVNKGDGFGNNELEFYTNRTDNAALDGDGSLVITAKKEAYMGREYTSARLESNGKFERAYGRVEARLQVPRGQGIWPAFWMLGNDIGSTPWPACGEIDIMENIGKEPSIVHGSLHGPGYSGGSPLGAAYTLPNGEKFADAFHVFAVEWETDVIRFYVDDHLYETRTPADVPKGGRWVYDHPFYLLLNVAIGGQWPGAPDGTTTFPQTMLVDYIRVYGR